jgi:LysM repeat protein
VNFQPKYEQTTDANRVKGGGAQRIHTENATHTGGIYRVINDIRPGSKLRLTAQGQVWSTNDESPISSRPSRDIKMKIGVDPLGGNEGKPSPLNGQVVWSSEQDPKDSFAPFSVEVEAKSPTVIVYTYATMRDNVRHNEVFWDDIVLELLAPPATATPEIATGGITTTAQLTTSTEAAAAPAAAPVDTAAVTYTIKAGDTLFGIAVENGLTLEDLQRNNPGVQPELLQIGQVLIIKPGAPPATATPEVAAQPTAEVVATPEGTTATPTVGQACVQAFFDDNGNGKRDENEDLVPDILFTLSANNAAIGSYTTTGVNEPYCFENLQNQAYTAVASVVDAYIATTPLNDTIDVDGAKSFFSVGLRRASDETKDVSKTPVPTSAPSVLNSANAAGILSIVGGGLLLLGALGFVVTYFIRRRQL